MADGNQEPYNKDQVRDLFYHMAHRLERFFKPDSNIAKKVFETVEPLFKKAFYIGYSSTIKFMEGTMLNIKQKPESVPDFSHYNLEEILSELGTDCRGLFDTPIMLTLQNSYLTGALYAWNGGFKAHMDTAPKN